MPVLLIPFRLIRVPYYCPKKFLPSDKDKPDDRELEDVDPIY